VLAGTELHMIYGLDLHAGQLDDAQSHLEEAVALAESLGDEVHLYFFRSDLIVLRLIQARYAELSQRCAIACSLPVGWALSSAHPRSCLVRRVAQPGRASTKW
jgi:hypothetical protein